MQKYRGEILMFVVAFIAAIGWFFSKEAIEEMPSVGFIGLRFAVATLIFLPFSFSQLNTLNSSQILRAGAVGLALTCNITIWVLAITFSTNFGEGAFIISLAMLIAPLLAWLAFKQKPARTFWLSMPIAMIGLFVLTGSQFGDFDFDIGTILFFFTALSAAVFFVLSSQYAKNIPTMALLTVQFSLVCLVCCAYSFFFEDWPQSISFETWCWFAASTLLATNFRYFLQIQGLRYCNIVTAALIMVLEPVWTLTLSVLILGEALTVAKTVGCSLILTAIIVYRLPSLWRR
ncbi:EamA domain-containing membrane protein RarD [Cricetibacter osteomyelitidis]|uniref:EamA domain-containing membrane protein RarD n=1 Tax=Cricetibacter osteomyelitidis TaxID=1521931 RepID=A0A4R2TJC6_9PAST|nr:DMT family transporter [Cricetibacter osteomyelitidis]TCP94912.1 EamA domain-containing membrane protein RarD [Cricetibacter osteomyelitidis]